MCRRRESKLSAKRNMTEFVHCFPLLKKNWMRFGPHLARRTGGKMMTVEISILLAFLGGFVGLAGWLGGRDKRIAGDAEWRGSVNAELDVIVGIRKDL